MVVRKLVLNVNSSTLTYIGKVRIGQANSFVWRVHLDFDFSHFSKDCTFFLSTFKKTFEIFSHSCKGIAVAQKIFNITTV